jgi:hypothetical protein
LILICVAALGGCVVGVAAHHWHARQKIDQLRQRLLRSEEARNGAIERSANAREQIAQLSKAITDLRKAHQTARAGATREPVTTTAEERRALAERALVAAAAADAADGSGDDESTSSGGVILFANTEPMEL